MARKARGPALAEVGGDTSPESGAPRERHEEPKGRLGALIRERIANRYGGNASAFARAMGMSQQYVHKLMSDAVSIPARQYRDVLGPELGLKPRDFFVVAGELTPEEADGGTWGPGKGHRLPLSSTTIEMALALQDEAVTPEARTVVVAMLEQLTGKPLPEFRALLARTEKGAPRENGTGR